MIGLQRDRSLRELNTLGFESIAERYVEAPDEKTLLKALTYAETHDHDVLLLGGGSNVVLPSTVKGLLVRLVGDEISATPAAPDGTVLLKADAGVRWQKLVEHSLALELGGLENLSLIPGTVGAAPVQNIGAYGVELSQRVVRVRAWHRPGGSWHELDADDCAFGYRTSRFKREPGAWIITSVTLAVGGDRSVVTAYESLAAELATRGLTDPTPQDVADAVIAIRRARLPDPAVTGNVGSFFQNPVISISEADVLSSRYPGLVRYPQADGRVKIAAGWLIDQLGLRGYRANGVGVHPRQALVLINEGNGNARALLALVDKIIDLVRRTYGITLVPEPVIV